MQIIGTNINGYICQLGKGEMALLTGKSEPWSADSHAHRTGTIVAVQDFSSHIRNMEHTIQQRKQVAETLRSCANIIETVPEAFTAPLPEPPPAPPAVQ